MRNNFSRKGAKAQRRLFRNAAALCVFARLREKSSSTSLTCLPKRVLGLLLVIFFLFSANTNAHEGPPFPLFVDHKAGSYVVSVWTDPDVGDALFFVIVSTQQAAEIPADLRVEVGVQPVSGRLPEAFYPGAREQLQGQVQYRAQVHFDTEELWQVRVRLQSAQGNAETLATVEATPPGYGRWDLLLYLLPFLAVGILWAVAIVRKTRRRTEDQHG